MAIRIPRTDEFRPLVLRSLADGREYSRHEVYERVAVLAGLGEEARAEELPSGGKRYINRINWACSSFVMSGLAHRPRRGVYQITEDGRTVDARNLATYSEKDMLEWPAWRDYQRELAERKAANDNGHLPTSANDATTENRPSIHDTIPHDSVDDEQHDPVEAIEELARDLNSQVETALLRRLQNESPDFFENAVVELLWAMGYGGTHGAKQRVGKSGDNGVDGIISQDPLGLTNVYIQAKRYADTNCVGTPEIRDFKGALDSHGAELGVFITTSRFLPRAKAEAEKFRHGRIILIDGVKLTALMLSYGVAVEKRKEIALYSIDEDFFDREL